MQKPKLPPPCFSFLNAELIEAGNGKAVARFIPSEEMENPHGVIQGGILAGMLDNLIGPAVITSVPDRASSTIQMSVNYLKAARAGQSIIGTAEIVKLGRTQAYSEAKLELEETGEILAKATATNVFLDKK